MNHLVKTSKLHLGDTELACMLLGLDAETITFSHFRDKDKVEIDVVLESGGRVAGVEVKAASTVTSDDFKGLRKLQDAVQERFAAGVVLYDGGSVVPFGSNLNAVPISCLWQTN